VFGDVVWTALAAMVWCIVPTPIVIGAVHGRRDVRAFSIGALVPWGAMIVTRSLPTPALFQGLAAVVVALLWMVILSAICGVVAVATRRWLERNDQGG
jgi:hypothetical protein